MVATNGESLARLINPNQKPKSKEEQFMLLDIKENNASSKKIS